MSVGFSTDMRPWILNPTVPSSQLGSVSESQVVDVVSRKT